MPCLSHLGRLPHFGLRVFSPCCLCGMSSTRNLAPSLHLRNLFELWSLRLSIHPELAAATTLIIHHSLCCFCAKLRFLCLKLHVESILRDTSTGQPQQRGCCLCSHVTTGSELSIHHPQIRGQPLNLPWNTVEEILIRHTDIKLNTLFWHSFLWDDYYPISFSIIVLIFSVCPSWDTITRTWIVVPGELTSD